MNPKVSIDPAGAISPGSDLTINVSWDEDPGATAYEVKLTLPSTFGVPERVAMLDATAPRQVRWAGTVPNVSAGVHDFQASVRAVRPKGSAGGKPIQIASQVSVAPWMNRDVFVQVKDELEAKAASIAANFNDAKAAIDGVGAQLKTVNTDGIRLQRASVPPIDPKREALWQDIRQSTQLLSYANYDQFLRDTFCNEQAGLVGNMRMPFSQVDAYLRLKAYTELFLLSNVGIVPGPNPNGLDVTSVNGVYDAQGIPDTSVDVNTVRNDLIAARPYLQVVLANNADISPLNLSSRACERLRYPVLLELIWCYWHEESLMVQTMHKIKWRFQNRSDGPGRDPLAQFEMDPLRPLNRIMWGYIQDEQHRLGVKQRAYEYLHAYGLSLEGKAVGHLRPADSRSRFLQTFHNLLYQAVQFYRQADDATIIANASPLLYALRDLQYVLAEGAHNQFGDLPWNARLEMLMEQWILARPEIQDFLRGRRMVPYTEGWISAVDTMKTVQGWGGTSAVHFRDLGASGEQILLSVREGGQPGGPGPGTGSWGVVTDARAAAHWASFWRNEIENYIHAYRAVTGVDLAIDPTDPRFLAERDTVPSVHLRRRMNQEVGR